MNRNIFSILLIVVSLIVQSYSTLLSYFLYVLAIILLSRDIYPFLVFLMFSGCPLRRIRCLAKICYWGSSKEKCVYFGYRIVDCKHGCYDLSEKEFWLRSLSFFNTAFLMGGEYIIFITKGDFYIILKKCDKSKVKIEEELLSLREAFLRGVELAGCKVQALDGISLESLLRPKWLVEVKVSNTRYVAVILLTLVGIWFFPPLLVFLPIELWILSLRKEPVYKLNIKEKGIKIYGLNKSTVTYTYPTLREVFTRARVIYSIVSTVEMLAIRLRPAPWEIASSIDFQAYRVYEIGTALDKLSMLHESQKYFFAARRRWERGEPVFLASGLLLASNETRELLERMGLHFGPDLLALKTLE